MGKKINPCPLNVPLKSGRHEHLPTSFWPVSHQVYDGIGCGICTEICKTIIMRVFVRTLLQPGHVHYKALK